MVQHLALGFTAKCGRRRPGHELQHVMASLAFIDVILVYLLEENLSLKCKLQLQVKCSYPFMIHHVWVTRYCTNC